MKLFTLASLALMLLGTTTSYAAEPQSGISKAARIDFEYDIANCAAYYNLESALAKKSGYGDTPVAKAMEQAAVVATQLAVELSRSVGMSRAALMAQIEMDMGNIAEKLGKDYVNTPSVTKDIGMPCKSYLEDPRDRMNYWVGFERKKANGNSNP